MIGIAIRAAGHVQPEAVACMAPNQRRIAQGGMLVDLHSLISDETANSREAKATLAISSILHHGVAERIAVEDVIRAARATLLSVPIYTGKGLRRINR